MTKKNVLSGTSYYRLSFIQFEKKTLYCLNTLTDIIPLFLLSDLGPVVQSDVSLTSLLRVISLTVLADSVYNILIFFAEKM